MLLDEIEDSESSSVKPSKEEVLMGKQALEKVCPLAPYRLYYVSECSVQIMVLSSHVFCRPQIRSVLARLAKEAHLKSEVLIRPVRTRWNTVTHSLGRAIDMQEVLDALCDMHQFNQPGGVRLRRFILDAAQWTIIRELYELLYVRIYLLFIMMSLR